MKQINIEPREIIIPEVMTKPKPLLIQTGRREKEKLGKVILNKFNTNKNKIENHKHFNKYDNRKIYYNQSTPNKKTNYWSIFSGGVGYIVRLMIFSLLSILFISYYIFAYIIISILNIGLGKKRDEGIKYEK